MNTATRIFLKGLLALLPLLLTLYPLYYFFSWAETGANRLLLWIWPELPYLPGMGILAGVAVIFALGILMSSRYVQRLYDLMERVLLNLPLVKSLYTAVKELTRYLTPRDRAVGQVVVMRLPGSAAEMVGFVTNEDLSSLPEGVEKTGRVAVYVPLSYQIGGLTLFVPRDWLKVLDIPVERAMRHTLTGWMTHARESGAGPPP